MMMTTDDIKKYEEQLLALRDQLSHEIKEVIQGADMGNDAGDADEESDEAEEKNIAHAEQIALKERMHAVLDALEKIVRGAYGVCEKCSGEIQSDILEIDPESRLCGACKAKE